MDDMDLVSTHHEELVREILEHSGAIERFEREHGIAPNFRNYYCNYLGSERMRNRTASAALARRRPVPPFAAGLRAAFGENPLVLDVGCGYGTDSLLLARLGCRVIAIDVNEDYIAVARQRLEHWRPLLQGVPEPEFSVGHIEDRRDLPEAAFHGVFSAECLHHCEPVENALLAIRRVIHEDGAAQILESNAANPLVRWKRNSIVTGPRRILNRTGNEFAPLTHCHSPISIW